MLCLFVKLLSVGYTAVQSLKAVSENILPFSAVFENILPFGFANRSTLGEVYAQFITPILSHLLVDSNDKFIFFPAETDATFHSAQANLVAEHEKQMKELQLRLVCFQTIFNQSSKPDIFHLENSDCFVSKYPL